MSRSRWHLFLFLPVVGLLFRVTWCYDPCPESLRGSAAAAKPPNIPESEVEKAFKEAKVKCREKLEMEKQQVRQGKVVNKKVKSAESVHPQANSPPRVRQLEMGQCQFSYASRSLSKKYNLTQEEVSCGLPKIRLDGPEAKSAVAQCTSNQTLQCDPNAKYRTADGTCNNLNNPTWGSAFTCVCRLLPAYYSGDDGFRESVKGGLLPPPRDISQNVHSNKNYPTDYVTHMYMFYGQLLDHDITLTPASMTENNEAIECCPPESSTHPQCAPIMVPRNDPFYSQFNVTCLNFVRSAICPSCATGPRNPMNQLTVFIDASFVYGNSDNETDGLRNQSDRSLLRTQSSQYGELLPASNDPQNEGFVTGDPRSNQHMMLTSLHTLFARCHNTYARMLRILNPRWSDETIFQEARKMTGATMQVITYKEYLPITIGNERMSYFELWLSQKRTYDDNLDPCMLLEFSTFAFRFGHTMINSKMAECPYRPGHDHYLNDSFFQVLNIYNGDMSYLLCGSTRSPAQCFDRHVVPDVTNFLYRIQGNPTGFDLPAFNIQRGRDHGLPPYIACVKFCSERQIIIKSFDDLCSYGLMSTENKAALQNVYRSVEDIDAFTGMISETYKPGAVVGPTAICIIGIQFYNLKYGDRFYFENLGQPCSYSTAQINEIRKWSLAQVMCNNIPELEKVPKNAFLYYSNNENPYVVCSQMPRPNLTAWKK